MVSERRPLLASFVTENGHETIAPTPLGEDVRQFWEQTPAIQAKHGNRVAVHACVCMPDHFHGVIEVKEPMEWSLGDIIQGMKTACTQRWWQMNVVPASIVRQRLQPLPQPEHPRRRNLLLRRRGQNCQMIHLSVC